MDQKWTWTGSGPELDNKLPCNLEPLHALTVKLEFTLNLDVEHVIYNFR